MKKLLALTVFAFGFLAAATASQAQTIAWGSAVTMSGDTDVANNGTAYDAVTLNPSNLTVNGVTFNSIPQSGHSHSDGIITIENGDNTGDFGTAFTTLPPSSVAYSALISVGTFGEATNTVTIADLTAGDLYQVQAWSYYTGDGTATTTYSGTTPVTLSNKGQFAIGTFTATSSTETFSYSTGGGHNFMNAVSVRDLSETSVPEPSTYGLLGLGLFALVILGKRKLQA